MIHLPSHIKRVLITGGSGFIGSALVRKLLMETNIKVYNLDKQTYASKLNYFEKYCNSNQYSSSCKMVIQIDSKDYSVSGYYVDKGFSKGRDNACDNTRIAHVTGRIKDDKFISDQFTLITSPN